MIIAVNFQLKQLERRSLKNIQGFNGIQTREALIFFQTSLPMCGFIKLS